MARCFQIGPATFSSISRNKIIAPPVESTSRSVVAVRNSCGNFESTRIVAQRANILQFDDAGQRGLRHRRVRDRPGSARSSLATSAGRLSRPPRRWLGRAISRPSVGPRPAVCEPSAVRRSLRIAESTGEPKSASVSIRCRAAANLSSWVWHPIPTVAKIRHHLVQCGCAQLPGAILVRANFSRIQPASTDGMLPVSWIAARAACSSRSVRSVEHSYGNGCPLGR